jgi:hypothetical protein
MAESLGDAAGIEQERAVVERNKADGGAHDGISLAMSRVAGTGHQRADPLRPPP